MDKNEALKIAERYIDRISKSYRIENAILFGSYAKGGSHPDSDIDIAIDFKISNPLVAEILKNGIEIKNYAA